MTTDPRPLSAPGGVHNHGTEGGLGVACPEYLIGACHLETLIKPFASVEEYEAWFRDSEARVQAQRARSTDLLDAMKQTADSAAGMLTAQRARYERLVEAAREAVEIADCYDRAFVPSAIWVKVDALRAALPDTFNVATADLFDDKEREGDD